MYRLTLLLLLCLFLLPGVADAQDGGELQCSDSDIHAAIDLALAQLQEAKSQDASTALATLVDIRAMLAELDAQCLGLTFSGTARTVHGPVYVPKGIYRVSVTTQRYFIMHATELEGSCGGGRTGKVYMFNEMGHDAQFTAELVFSSEGCTVLFETDNVLAPYTVTFEKIR